MRNSLCALVALGLLLPATSHAQSVTITGMTPTETFSVLGTTGSANTTMPQGWYFAESGSNANATYRADTGGLNNGDTYSYGSAAGDRALGGLRSGSLVPTIGAQLWNATGSALTELQVAYSGERWRVGATSRSDRLDFQYSVDATSLTTGTWVDVDVLDFAVAAAEASGALDGNANATAIAGSITGLSVPADGTIWIRWTDADATGADDGLAIDDVTITAGPAVDVPPAVTSTTPVDDQLNVAITTNILVNFSEPVSTGSAWFRMFCSGDAGSRTVSDFAISGGPRSYTLNPNTDLPHGTWCTATIDADQITDLDGTPEIMANPYQFTFDTVAAPVDNPPTVSAITPAAGATNVSLGTTIQVTFSEPVTTNAAAFALTCDNIAQTFAFAGNGTVFTLNPDADLPAVTTCSVAIDDAGVLDQDGTIQQMVADFLASFTTRAAGGDYYGGVDTSSCSALRTTLHAAIKDHRFFPYSSASTDTWDILEQADQDPLDANRIVDVYLNASYPKYGQGNNDYNREHTWPNSLGYNDRTGDEAYTDTHMLYLSNDSYNTFRSNIPYDNCNPAVTASCAVLPTQAYNGRGGGPTTSYPGDHNWYSSSADRFEVWNARKGDVARAILYMDIRYEGGTNALSGRAEPDLIVTDDRSLITTRGSASTFSPIGYMGIKSVLLQWHAADPPDAQEQLRNDIVFSYQENRNPFIDRPEWVSIAFASPCGTTGTPNATPVFNDSTTSILENASAATLVSTLAATDADPGQTLTYTIRSGNDGAAFSLSPNGELRVATPAAIDGAVRASYTLVVRATDNGASPAFDDATITVNVTPVNDAPSFTKGANPEHQEDAGAITLSGWASNISAGPGDEAAQALTFEVMQNDNASLFSAGPTIAPNGTLSYTLAPNANGVATLTIRLVDDGGTANGGVNASASTQLTINVTQVNDAPALGDATFSIASNLPSGSLVGTVVANDIDGPAPNYSITSGNTGGAFLIEGDGEIRVANAAALTNSSFTLTVEASDGSAAASATVTVNVTQPGDVVFSHGFE